MIICDLTRKETFQNLYSWVNSLFNVTKNIPVVFVGNKIDLTNQLQVNETDLSNISAAYQSTFFKTSAKTGENVEKAFYELGTSMFKTFINNGKNEQITINSD